MAFIFQDSNGVDHAINNNDSFCKALNLPESNRLVLMTDESGQLVSMGNTAEKLEHNGNLIKALRMGEAITASHLINKGSDALKGKMVLFAKGTSAPSLKKSKPLEKSFSRHSSLLSLLDELEQYKASLAGA
ncbi:MAG: hypothetical protein WCP66_12475 [Methylococcales bacterium]